MKTSTHSSIRVSLEMGMIAFFILAATSLLVVYLADPALYAQSLALTSSPADRYPVPVTLFLVGVLTVIALLSFGVVRHWRWVFWLMLVGSAVRGSPLRKLGCQERGDINVDVILKERHYAAVAR